MLLTEQHIQQYKRLENPPQALYNALVRQVQVTSMHKGRVFTVPEGGYMALAVCRQIKVDFFRYKLSEC